MRAIVPVVVVLAAAAARPALADEPLAQPAPRQGYYLAVGGAAMLTLANDAEHHVRHSFTGGSLGLRAGEMLTDWAGRGLRLDLGQARAGDWRAALGGIGVDAQLAPWRGLALHAGAGVGYWQATDRRDPDAPARGTGGAYYSAGVTYDVFLTGAGRSGGVAVTPGVFVKYLPGSDYRSVVLWGGLELSLWSGLPREKLALEGDAAYRRD